MKRRLMFVGALAALSLAACTPDEVELWLDWRADDQEAADDWANEWIAQQRAGAQDNDNNDDQGGGSGGGGGGGDQVDGGVWDRVAECESGGNWSINTGNGYYGGLQFALSSWRAVGGSGYPHQASKAEQIQRAEMLLDEQGWDAWPTCASRLGLR